VAYTLGYRKGEPARAQAVLLDSIASRVIHRRVPPLWSLLQVAVFVLDRQLCGHEIGSTYVASGSAAPVGDPWQLTLAGRRDEPGLSHQPNAASGRFQGTAVARLDGQRRRLTAAAVIRAPITTGRNQSQAARQALADTRAPQIADM
jgi:hypothetical protein